jgi:TP901 family phage tail tape measure protein
MTGEEIERLIVRLVGDTRDFDQVMEEAEDEINRVVKEFEAATKGALKAQNEALAEAARITNAVATPLERYGQELKKLDAHLDAGRISQETYSRAIQTLMQTMPATQAAQDRMNAEIQEAAAVTNAVLSPVERYQKKLADLDRLLEKGRISQQTHERAARQMMATLPSATAAQERMNKALQVEERELAKAEALLRSTATAQERFAQEVGELNTLLNHGRISWTTYTRAVDKAKKELKEAEAAANKTAQAWKQFGSTLQNAGGIVQRFGSGVTRVGVGLTAGITAPVAAAGVASAHAAAQFEQSLADLRAAANPTKEEMKAVSEAAMGLSKDLRTVRPVEVAESMTELLKAGISLEQVLGGDAKAAIEFAKVGKLEMGVAATIMADSMKVFGENAKTTGNVLSSAADASSISISQIAESFSQVSAAAALVDQSLEDTAAAIAVMGNAGVKGSDAGTSLKTMFLRLQTPLHKGREAIEQYGIQIRDASGTVRPLIQLIAELQTKLGGLGKEARDKALYDIFGQDAIRAASILMTTGVEGFDAMKESMSGALSVSEKFAIQNETFMGKWQEFLATLNRLWISLGNNMLPLLTSAVGWITQIVEKVGNWAKQNPEMARMAGIIAAIAAAMGPIVIAVGGALTAFGGLVVMVGGFIAIGWEVVLIAGAIVAGFLLVTAEIAAVAAAFAGLVYWIVGPESLSAAWETATTFAMNFFKGLIGFIANFQHNMKALYVWFVDNWELVVMDIQTLWFGALRAGVNNLNVILRTMRRLWVAWQGWLVGRFMSIFTVDFVNAVIKGVIKVGKIFGNFAYQAWETLKAIFTGRGSAGMTDFVNQLGKDFQAGMEETNFASTAANIIKEEFGNLESPFAHFESSIKDGPDLIFDWSKETGQAAVEGFEEGLDEASMTTEELYYHMFGDAGAKKQHPALAALEGFHQEVDDTSKSVQKLIDEMKEEAETMGMSAAQKRVWKLEQEGATAAQLYDAIILADRIDLLNKEKKELEKAQKITEKFQNEAKKHQSPLEKYKEESAELSKMFEKGLISLEAYEFELKELEKGLNKDLKVKFSVSGVEAVEAGSAAAIRSLAAYRSINNATSPLGVLGIAGGEKRFTDNGRLNMVPRFDPGARNPEGRGSLNNGQRIESLLEMIASNTDPDGSLARKQTLIVESVGLS